MIIFYNRYNDDDYSDDDGVAQEPRPNPTHELRCTEGAHHHIWGNQHILNCSLLQITRTHKKIRLLLELKYFFAGPARGRRGPVERFLHISHNLQDHFKLSVTCHTNRFHVHLWLQRPFSLSSLHLESGRGFFWISKLWKFLSLNLPALVTLMKRITSIELELFYTRLKVFCRLVACSASARRTFRCATVTSTFLLSPSPCTGHAENIKSYFFPMCA